MPQERVVPELHLQARLLRDPLEELGLGFQHVERDFRVGPDPDLPLFGGGGHAPEAPLDPAGHRGRRVDPPAPPTAGAPAGEGLIEGRAHPLAGHLHETELGDLERAGPGPIAAQVALELVEDPLPVVLRLHVDEVHDDDPTHVPQPELAGHLLGGVEVGPEDRLLGVPLPLPRELPGVHVDGDERLGGLDDDVPAGGEPDLGLERLLDLLLDPVGVEERLVAPVELDPVLELGLHRGHVLDHLAVDVPIVDDEAVELVAEEVPDHAAGELGFPVHLGGRLVGVRPALDLPPRVPEALELPREDVPVQLLADGPDDDAAVVRGHDVAGQLLQAPPLLPVVDLPADADVGGVGHVDEEAAREGDLGGEPRALGADGFLRHLDQDLVALAEVVLDGGVLSGAAPAAVFVPVAVLVVVVLVLVPFQVRGVEEARLPGADVHERRLDPRQHRVDPSQEDVSHQPPLVGTVEHQLNEFVVFEKRHPLFLGADADQDFAFQVWSLRSVVSCRAAHAGGCRPVPPPPIRHGVGSRREATTERTRSGVRRS